MHRKRSEGFTLIELMMVVSIIGILAAIAIPQYQDYTVRTKISEALAQFGAAKLTISEYYQSQGSMPSSGASAGLNGAIDSKYVNSITWSKTSADAGVLTANMSGNLGAGIANDETVVMEGAASITRVAWNCKPGTIQTRYLPSECRE